MAWRAAYLVVGSREGADDAVQDAFERVFRNLSRFDVDRPFAPWLRRIVINCAIDHARGSQRHAELDENVIGSLDGGLEVADDLRLAISAIAQLPLDHRVAVVLRLIYGFSPDEAADILGVRVGTIHSRLSRALKDLRERIEVGDDR